MSDVGLEENANKIDTKQLFLHRVYARIIDLSLVQLIYVSLLIIFPAIFYLAPFPYSLQYPLLGKVNSIIILSIIFILYDAVGMSKYGTTIGKSLYNIKVTKADGQYLSFADGAIRSFAVFIRSCWQYFNLIFVLLTYFFIKKNGIAKWDEENGFLVSAGSITSAKNRIISSISTMLLIFITFVPPGNRQDITEILDKILCYQEMSDSKQTNDLILKLDTGGHMDCIRKIIPMKDGRRIISASEDMSIRIWDTETGRETVKILGQIEKTFFTGEVPGGILSIALTPDERWLAVGGLFNTITLGDIRIYDLKTGVLSRVIKSHTNSVNDLSVSSDGKYLVSGGSHTVNVWDINNNFSLVHTFKGHKDIICSVKIFNDGNDYKIVSTGGMDNTIKLWSLNNKIELMSYAHYSPLLYLAINDQYIAVSAGVDNSLMIFDHNLKLVKNIPSVDIPAGLAFSPDGKLLLAGSMSEYTDNISTIYDTQNDFKSRTTLKTTNRITNAVTFLNNRTAVTGGGGGNNDIYLWDAYTGLVKRQIQGHGKSVWSVGIKAREIVYGNLPANNRDFGKTTNVAPNNQALVNTIDLDTLLVSKSRQLGGMKRINKNYQEYSLDIMDITSDSKDKMATAPLVVKKNTKEIVRINRNRFDGIEHTTYGFTKDGIILSGGMNGFLTAYNKQGQKLATFIGHTGEVRDIAIDGDILVSGSSDQTIKLWSVKELGSIKPNIQKISNETLRDLGDSLRIAFRSEITKNIGYLSIYETKKYVDFISNNRDKIELFKNVNMDFNQMLLQAAQIKPIVSMFISNEGEWAIWTEEGFYNASSKGDQYVGWHVNRGSENAAEYYRAKQFRKFLYRPDIIQKSIELGSSKRAIDAIAKNDPSIKEITVAKLIERAPVDVKIDSVQMAKDGRAEVLVRLGKNNTTAPERLTLFVNGFQQLTEAERAIKGAKPGDILKYMINLPDNKNSIKVTVENQWAENSHEMSVDNPNGNDIKSTKSSTLYVASVGISNYPELQEDQQLISPPLDARSIGSRFKKLEGKLFKKADIKVLADEKNTKITSNMVEQALKEQTQKAGAMDTTIIFLAGHGVTDSKGSYNFITADTKLTDAFGEQINLQDGTSFDWKRLHGILDKTMGRRVLIVDTCQAGEVFSNNKTDIKRLVKDVHDVNSIVYSGTSRQDFGIETSTGGVFTTSLLRGFDGKASYDNNLLSFMKLKEYVNKEVPRLNAQLLRKMEKRSLARKETQGTEQKVDLDCVQKPMAVVPDGMEKFIIYGK